MRKLKILLPALFCCFFLISLQAHAQDYRTGIGLRGGPGYGLTIKQFVSATHALEGIVSPRWEGYLITALYEKHAITFDVNRLKYYGGAGGHVGIWNYQNNYNSNNPWVRRNERQTVVGVDLILGIEYTFTNLPFNIGVDWKPMLNLYNDGSFRADDIAFSLRFIPGNM